MLSRLKWRVSLPVGCAAVAMALLVSDSTPSDRQRDANWIMLLGPCLVAVQWGALDAYRATAIGLIYASEYLNLYAFFKSVGFLVVAVPPLIYWRTRWLGYGLAAAAILSLLSYGITARILVHLYKLR